MAQTFLQLINKVLVALREDTVMGLNESYTQMIGQFINDAKEEIEDGHAWRCLRTEVSFSATSGNNTTTLTSTNYRSYVVRDNFNQPMVYKTVANEESQIQVVPIEVLRTYRLSSDADVTNEPSMVAFTTDGTNVIAHFWPKPDATYTYKAVMIVPQDDLEAEADTLTIPWRPVVLKATFLAMDERGSEFAGRLETTAGRAQKSYDQAVLNDLGAEELTLVEE